MRASTLGAPILIRTPSGGNGRTITPAASQAQANSVVLAPNGNQTKLPWASGGSQPAARSASMTRLRSSTNAATRSRSSTSAANEAIAAAWATVDTPNGTAQARAAAATAGGATT